MKKILALVFLVCLNAYAQEKPPMEKSVKTLEEIFSVDQACMQSCLAQGSTYGFCKKQCSY